MRIHRISGRDLEEALRRARARHGEDALVVSREALAGGGVALAVVESGAKHTSVEASGPSATVAPEVHPGLRDVRARLEKAGASQPFVERVLEAVDGGRLEREHALDLAAEVLGGLFSVARAPRSAGRTRVTSLLGPSGGGKTSTLVKLAARLVAAKRRVALASLDVRRVGALERLQAFAQHLGLPLIAVEEPEDLRAVFTLPQGAEICLVDGTGSLADDARVLEHIAEVDARFVADACVVLPATASRATLRATLESHARIAPTSVSITKLDETRECAPALEAVEASGLPLAFLCDGRDVERSLHRASADAVADLFLRGRLA